MGMILQNMVIMKKRSEKCKKSMNADAGLIQEIFTKVNKKQVYI